MPTVNIKLDEKNPIKELSAKEKLEKFDLVVKKYKKQNPHKYEIKKEALKAKRELLKKSK